MANEPRLFAPTTIGSLSLRNAVVMAPMTRCRADREGVQPPIAVTYYRQRASAGLIITEGTQCSYQGQGYCRTPGMHTVEQVKAWRAITHAVHEAGGLIALQIMHVGRIGHPLNQLHPAGFVAPSAVAAAGEMYTDQEGFQPKATPEALTEEGIAGIVEEHRRSTELAFEAGFDGVELHGANGYLGQQFLSSNANLRTDGYGGSPEGRSRYIIEVLKAMSSVDGAGRIGVRLSPGGNYNDIVEDDPASLYAALFAGLHGMGLGWVHLQNTGWPQETLYDQIDAALIITGGYDSADKAEETLTSTPAAAIGFGQYFVANPDLPYRLRNRLPLQEANTDAYFTPGPEGYIDYPTWDERQER
ncbi:alkene reductase [Haliangium sp.]|uniref:alkene reductase n=1 Tax=Haliangium sp. TaxID=2663208 RepID=UPI003D0ED1FC